MPGAGLVFGRSTIHVPYSCPVCGIYLYGTAQPTPERGDWCVCMGCGRLWEFGEDGRFAERRTPAELTGADNRTRRAAARVIASVKAQSVCPRRLGGLCR